MQKQYKENKRKIIKKKKKWRKENISKIHWLIPRLFSIPSKIKFSVSQIRKLYINLMSISNKLKIPNHTLYAQPPYFKRPLLRLKRECLID